MKRDPTIFERWTEYITREPFTPEQRQVLARASFALDAAWHLVFSSTTDYALRFWQNDLGNTLADLDNSLREAIGGDTE